MIKMDIRNTTVKKERGKNEKEIIRLDSGGSNDGPICNERKR
jgi:hypothetical protein